MVYCVQLILSKFSEFQLGIEAGSKRFERVDKMATELVEEENPRSTVILERQEDLRYTNRFLDSSLALITSDVSKTFFARPVPQVS